MIKEEFIDRHSGIREQDLKSMLKTVGVKSLDELIDQVVPASIRLPKPLELPEAMSEWEFAAHIGELAAKNAPLRSFIGMGYYPAASPAVILRNIFENPAWYTSYTPYQAEISQGRLEALLNYQTMIVSMTGLPLANCSLLDEATAAAEAMFMMFSSRSREAVAEGRNVVVVDENIFPQTLDVLMTRAEGFGIEIVCDDPASYEFNGKEFGAILQYPGADGRVLDFEDFCVTAHDKGALVAAACDILSLALLREPASWGADIAVGSIQRMGLPMGFGGPQAGYMAAREEFKRVLPGRIIGVSVDRLGNRALRMALQTREQHIKREKATSNICTAQALMATMAGMYAVYQGPEGLKRIASGIHQAACTAAGMIKSLGLKLASDNFFDTLQVEIDSEKVREIALAKGYNLFYPDSEHVRLSFDELTTDREILDVVSIFAKAAGKSAPKSLKKADGETPRSLARRTAFLNEEIFQQYRSETELMRYIKKLERRDISLMDSMIPLGSCTMKLNPAAAMIPLSLSGFGAIHPFVPADQAQGYLELIEALKSYLGTITGLKAVSLQPNSGAAGEYAGLMVIRAYHQSRGQGFRNIALIPASAHGTNPASAAMAGMKIVVVKCDERGNIDLEDLKEKAQAHAAELSCVMVTYPSTHGVFEGEIKKVVDIVHDAGGMVYMDGANMNAQVGLTSPGRIGADVCHLNLHKTFAMPHGGGGPGVGPICVAPHLAPFLPSHPIVETGGEMATTAVAAAPYGSAMLLPITYGYIRMLGAGGLKKATETAILNANYLSKSLEKEFRTFYTGQTGRVGHELILDLQNFKKEYNVGCDEVARRLMDYGFHAPTLSFPVHDTLMIEPTESESKAEMDRFAEALTAIKRECEQGGEVVRNAPHTAAEIASDDWQHPYTRKQAAFPLEWSAENKFFPHVSRIDGGFGDRNLVCVNDFKEQQ